MANALLIWDNNKNYTEKLSADLGISYTDDVVFSISEFEKNKYLETKDCIVVLLETNIEGEPRTNFKGIEIIKTLRKDKRYKGLIVAYSTYPESHFRNRKDAKILFTAGTRLRQFAKRGIDADEIEELLSEGLKKVPKLSEDLLDDLHYNIFDARGIIHELLHRLKNTVNNVYKEKTIVKIIESVNHKFEDYKKQLLREIDPQKISNFNKHFASLVSETKADIEQHWKDKEDKTIFKYSNAGNQVSKFSNQIADLAPKSNDDAENKQEEKVNWEVLFFDDTEGIRKIVYDYFKAMNVVCHLAATEEEVYKKLKENAPRISLFISDIRLEEENGNWFDRQGYDVIEQVSRKNDYPLVYSVLTSKKGTINKMVQQKRKYEILWFTKDDVISSSNSFNIFFDTIKKYADDNFSSNNVFQPDASAWLSGTEYKYRYPLKTYYRHHKQTTNSEFIIIENAINKKVVAFIESIIPQYRNSIGKDTFIQNWRCLLSENVIDEYELKKFRENKLLGRRLILALAVFYELPSLKIFEIMTGEKDNDKKGGTKTLFGQMAISQKLMPLKEQIKSYSIGDKLPILKEEYDFLKEEFIDEELSSIEDLGKDHTHLKAIVNDIKAVFEKKNLLIPPTLMRVKYILENEKMPKPERLNRMLSEIVLLDKTNNIINEINVKSPFKQIENTNLVNLFLRHQFVSF
ncbi:MAG: hypothetical protein NTY88_10995 [Bacteroidetes bacterium]|nr:hypothetical protein [Bacteroidota bacterium]